MEGVAKPQNYQERAIPEYADTALEKDQYMTFGYMVPLI